MSVRKIVAKKLERASPQQTPIKASAHPAWFSGLPERLAEAVTEYDLVGSHDWVTLDELSSNTEFEGIEVFGSDSVAEGNQFIAPGTIYVKLTYNTSSKEDGVSFSDSYPVRVFFTVDHENENINVSRVEVDTSSFFE